MTSALALDGGRRWVLIHGNCMDETTGLPAIPAGLVHHVIMDPPYEAEAHTLQRRVKRMGNNLNDEPLPFEPMTEPLRASVSLQSGRIVTRWVLTFCQVEAVKAWQVALTNGGLTYKRTCLWIKPDGQPQLTGDRPGMGYETIVTAHAPGRSRWNGGGKVGVYKAMRHQDHGPKHLRHPTVKPLDLMEALIRDFTDRDDVIVDPFAGSGSTGVAALRLGRRFIGWEVDDKYHALAMKRLTDTREQADLLAIESFERGASEKRKQTELAVDPEQDE